MLLTPILRYHQRRHVWRVLQLFMPPAYHVEEERMVRMLDAIWSGFRQSKWAALCHGQRRLAYEIHSNEAGTSLCWAVPAPDSEMLRRILQTYLNGAESVVDVEAVADPLQHQLGGKVAVGVIRPRDSAAYRLSAYTRDFAPDLLGLLARLRPFGQVTIQMMLRPLTASEWVPRGKADLLKAEGKRAVDAPNLGQILLDGLAMLAPSHPAKGKASQPAVQTSRMERLATKETPAKLLSNGFDVQIRIAARAETYPAAQTLLYQVGNLFHTLSGTNHLAIQRPGLFERDEKVFRSWAVRSSPVTAGRFILTPDELTSVVNPLQPRALSEDGTRVIELRQPPRPDGLHIVDGIYRGKRVAVRVDLADLDQHYGIFGETGSGKGVTLENLVREAARCGLGGLYIDPMGNSVRKVLASMPEQYMDRVIYLEAGNPRWAIPLNFLATGEGGDVESTVAETLNLYFKLWESAWGKNTEELLSAATRAAIDIGGTLVEAELILTDPAFRQRVLGQVQNGSIRHFLANLPDKLTENMRAPLNKLHELLWKDSILVMVGQQETLDWRQIIKDRMIVLVNANKGNRKIGELGCALVSTVIWSQVTQAAMVAPEHERQRFIMVADELRDVAKRAGGDFETGLIQLRQFKKPIFGAGQYAAQLPDDVYSAMMGTGSKIVLRQEAKHAKESLEYLTAERSLKVEDLAGLPNLTGYANLLVGGRKTGLFTCYAPPFSLPIRDADEAAERCLERWAKPRDRVLAEISQRIKASPGEARNARPELT